MLRFPNAKINLGLHITRKRDDGYHELETVFYPVKHMRDALEVVPAASAQSSLHVSGLAVEGDVAHNLAWKAYLLLQERFPGRVAPLDMYLHKAIPMGAGLGGGSADAAFALVMINEHCGLGLRPAELEALALQLGSDCPFFIRNSPQYAGGRGEEMEPLALDLSDYRIEVVCPDVHVSTAAAFSRVVPKPAEFDLRDVPQLPVSEWKGALRNDFEESVFAQAPQIGAIKEQLYADGALYASMSGSGSAVYGIFEK
jgi:4-diphosphocytidyl-2-C-methyl-D-erythritol kinase